MYLALGTVVDFTASKSAVITHDVRTLMDPTKYQSNTSHSLFVLYHSFRNTDELNEERIKIMPDKEINPTEF